MRSFPFLDQRIRPIARVIAVLILGGAGCGEDTILSPGIGSTCRAGEIRAGETKTGAFAPSSCTLPYHFLSATRTPYESYTVRLQKGTAYLFSESGIPDPAQEGLDRVDPMLTLWGTATDGTTIPLAVNYDWGAGSSQLHFIAPESGVYQLMATSFSEYSLGGFQVSARECPVLATLVTPGTYAFTLRESPCHREGPRFVFTDTSGYVMLAIPALPGEQIRVTVSAAAFLPVWEMHGPGFDTYALVYPKDGRFVDGRGSGSSGGFTMGNAGGIVTLAVGATSTDSLGGFNVRLERTPPISTPATVAR